MKSDDAVGSQFGVFLLADDDHREWEKLILHVNKLLCFATVWYGPEKRRFELISQVGCIIELLCSCSVCCSLEKCHFIWEVECYGFSVLKLYMLTVGGVLLQNKN